MCQTRCAEAEHLIGKLAGVGVYVLSETAVPTDSETLGWTNGEGVLDQIARPTLEKDGRWQGRRPAIVLNFGAIDRMARVRADPENVASEARLLTGLVAVHECAHILCKSRPYYGPELGVVAEEINRLLNVLFRLGVEPNIMVREDLLE